MMAPPPRPAKAFRFPLPVDPLRLLYGIREQWLRFLLLPLIGLVAGAIAGEHLSENRYSVSLQLIKSPVPNTIQTSESGEAFRPRELSDDTLLATTYSSEVLNRTGERLDPPRSGGAVKGMVQIEKQRNTDLFYLTAHSRLSADDAVAAVTVWAEEVIRFTNNLQREEAITMQRFINEQITTIDRQLKKVNQQILDFAKESNFVDVETQTESTITSLDNLRVRLAETRIALESKGVQIQRYREELRAQSPLEADLKIKREELASLRGRYTDENPLVQEKLYEIRHLEGELKATAEASLEDLKNFTGSDLGNNLYLEILALENERSELERQVASLETMVASKESEVSTLPEKALALSDLRAERERLLLATSLLESRLKEASFYVSNAPGYWRVFQEPQTGEVAVSSEKVKAILLGFVGAAGGFALAICFAAIWELRQPELRTPIDAAIATRTAPLLRHVTGEVEPSWGARQLFSQPEGHGNASEIQSFWLTELSPHQQGTPRRALFAVLGDPSEEVAFWQRLLDQIATDGYATHFINLAKADSNAEVLTALHQHPAIRSWGETTTELETLAEDTVLVRLGRDPRASELDWILDLDAYYLLLSPTESQRSNTRREARLLAEVCGPARGMVLLDAPSGRTVPRALNALELTILRLLDSKNKGGNA